MHRGIGYDASFLAGLLSEEPVDEVSVAVADRGEGDEGPRHRVVKASNITSSSLRVKHWERVDEDRQYGGADGLHDDSASKKPRTSSASGLEMVYMVSAKRNAIAAIVSGHAVSRLDFTIRRLYTQAIVSTGRGKIEPTAGLLSRDA